MNILYPLAGYSTIVFIGFMIYKELKTKIKGAANQVKNYMLFMEKADKLDAKERER